MKEKIAYLRGLMEGMQLPDDNNGKLLRAIADCLDAIADEVLVESARSDVVEEQLDLVSDEVEEIEDVLEELLDEDDEDDEDYEDEADDEDEDDEEVYSIDLNELKELLMDKHGGFCGHHGRHHHHGPCHHGRHGHHHGCCEHGHFFDEADDEDEDWFDEFNYFTCPNCGEIVPLDDDALEKQSNPICPKCNSPLFTEGETEKTEKEEE